MPERPPIPAETKRKVRQRCGFGCVICGCPIFQYDHMIEYSQSQSHDEQNLTLLCGTHHQQKTSGQISIDTILRYNEFPLCRGRDRTGKAFFDGRLNNQYLVFVIGGHVVQFAPTLNIPEIDVINIDGMSFFSIEVNSGSLFIRKIILTYNAKTILLVEDGEISMSTGVFDIRYVGQRLKISKRKYNTICDIEISSYGVIFHKANVSKMHETNLFSVNISKESIVSNYKGKSNTFQGNFIDVRSGANLGTIFSFHHGHYDDKLFKKPSFVVQQYSF